MNGRNSVLKLDFDELESDGLPLRLSALTKAAHIGACNTKNCLGPGGDASSVSPAGNTEPEFTNQRNPKSPSDRNGTTKISSPPVSIKTVDYDLYQNFAFLQLAEKQRKAIVRQELEDKRKQFQLQKQAKTAETIQSQHSELHANEIKSRKEQSIIEEAEYIASELHAENARRLQQRDEENAKRIDQLKKQQAARQQRLLRKNVADHQQEFVEMYEEFGKRFRTLKSPDRLEKFKQTMIQLLMKYNTLDERLKGNLEQSDLRLADKLLEDLNSLRLKLDDELVMEANEQKARAQQASDEKNAQVQASQQPALSVVDSCIPAAVDNGISAFVSPENFALYNSIMSFYWKKVEGVKSLQANEAMKKYRSNCQKAINIPVNAISAVSREHLQDKYDKLYGLISGAKISTSDGPLSAMDHPLGQDFCLLLLAKKFVSQGDSTVSSNPQAAFPIAAIVVAIWHRVPEFGQLFLSYAFKECPYLVPYFIPQVEGQNVEDYFKVLGYRISAEGLEKQDMYLKRQSGLVKLYAAVMVSRPRIIGDAPHPYGIENGWRWLNNLLNLDPLPDICATLIHGFLQIAGFEMMRVYRSQFIKTLKAIHTQYMTKLSKIDEGGPKARLEVFLVKVLKENTIDKPPGLLAPNFW